ncbi:MAG TPA: DnaA regulatory inactivator Hda [Burkholderiales bacterium]|jgi:DnaA family protein|nr:DnaA regulatory inactivator Hda [Burkholderiales bacterium]
MKQLALDFASIPPPTLHNFVAGRNGELLQNLQRFAMAQGGERSVYVWGAPGSGRSHLLRGAVDAACAMGADGVYVACSRETRLADDLGGRDFVAVDEVQHLDAQAQIALFNICNALRERDGALLASGNTPPAQLALRQDLVTRLGWGLVYQVHALSDDEKVQALQRQAAERGFMLADDVCAYLLTHAPRDMSSLLALLDGLDRYSLEVKRPVTAALARELLQAAKRSGLRIED